MKVTKISIDRKKAVLWELQLKQEKKQKVQSLNNIQKSTLGFKEKLSYGFGDLGNGMMFDMGQIYLMMFFTDILGISAFYGGLVFLVAKSLMHL